MKKLILSAIACFVIVLSSCNQNSPTPSPATPSPATPTPTSTMTATESALVGDWIWDETQIWNNGIKSITYTPISQIDANGAVTTNTMYSGTHMVLKSSIHPLTTQGYLEYNANYYSLTSPAGSWYVLKLSNGIDNMLFLNGSGGTNQFGSGYIITLNATTLICQMWTPNTTPSGRISYYHK
ncbi:MAG: hypothetical protein K9H41_08615 [Bacteroidia bacterium]|nr:hypothetical protein [Bacteroidia bacterium]